MKKVLLSLVAVFTMTTAMAQRDQATFQTNGYASKANIEAAAKKVGGVKSAEYTAKNKRVKVVYDKSKTTPDKIRKAVLKVDKKAATCKKSTKTCASQTTKKPRKRTSK